MDPSNRPAHGATILLVGLILVLGLGAAFAALVPVLECPENWYHARVVDAEIRGKPFPSCERCRGRSRITLLDRWLRGPGWKPSPY